MKINYRNKKSYLYYCLEHAKLLRPSVLISRLKSGRFWMKINVKRNTFTWVSLVVFKREEDICSWFKEELFDRRFWKWLTNGFMI